MAYLSSVIKTKISILSLPFSKIIPKHTAFCSSEVPNNNSLAKEQTLLSIFKKCVTLKNVEQIHAQIIQSGLHQNLYLVGKIIVFCAVSDRGSMDYAASVFKNVESPDGFMWNTMIRGFVRTMQVKNIFEYFKKMQENGEKADNFTFSFLLKVSGQLGSVLLGKQIHCSVLKYGLEDHVFVRNTLIHTYGMLKEVDIAQQLFEEMCSRDVVTWNVIIDCHVNCGNYNEGLGLFSRMMQCGVNFDDVTLVPVLAACSALGNLNFGRWIHRLVDNAGMKSSVMVMNSLIEMYAKCGQVEEAQKIFNESRERNLVTWNSLILGLATNGQASEALELFSRMLAEKFQTPNDVSFLGVLCACSHGGMVEKGRQYFDLMTKEYGIEPNIQHYGYVVDMLGRAGFVDEAYNLIKSMPLKCNAIVWRTLLAACQVHSNVKLGEVVRRHLLELEPDHSSDNVLLANMNAGAGQWRDVMNERHSTRARGVKPMPTNNSLVKEQTLHSIFKKCITLKNVEQVHAHIIQAGLHQNLYLVGKIIVFCAVSDCGSMDYATSVFKNVENPDGFMWNTMIRGFVRTMQVENIFEYFKKMQEKGEKADNFTFSFLLKVSGQWGSVLLGKEIHCSVLKHGLEDHVFVRNTLIHMYGMLKEIDTAQQLFDEMCTRNVVTWNVIIDCHVNCGNCNEGLRLFLQMMQCGVNFDDATLVAVLAACSASGNLDFGRWIRCLVDNAAMGSNVMVLNSLIEMYAKCGQVEEALKIFNESDVRNLVTWNSLILGLATNGHASEALELFSKLLAEKLQTPNDVTFLGVLCACSHGGMVEKGRQYFDLMTKEYNIEPNIQHYGCVVDMLGRDGFVDEAYHLIKSMPLKCNAIVWRTLLAACRVHSNVELGEVARRHLLELEPDHSSDYVLLANMYAGAGQWRDVMNERHSMRARGVQKPMPGNSIIRNPA